MRERIEFDNPKSMDEANEKLEYASSRISKKEKVRESDGWIKGIAERLWETREFGAILVGYL